ncbi:hypothetical protein [Paenibacillus sp. FJAT-26967]|uniref:hypothetical protein n=1 Tax=Paenibacillus sp. FJAT-26967 TaxID=1729690 RepID=UPI0008394B8F|nr:hypothetical protein [Paenibacillus sp. FJAT-26967]
MLFLRKRWFKTALLFSLIICSIVYWNKDYIKDWMNWSTVSSEIENYDVNKITINPLMKSSITINEEDKLEIVNLLKKAKYVSSNRQGHGSTPDGSLTLYFHKKILSFAYYKDSRGHVSSSFELSPKYIEENSQFWIKSDELAEFLNRSLYGK